MAFMLLDKMARLIPLSRADNSCISVAIIYDGHKIMIENKRGL